MPGKQYTIPVSVDLKANATSMKALYRDISNLAANIDPSSALAKNIGKVLTKLRDQVTDFELISNKSFIQQSDVNSALSIFKRFYRDVGRMNESVQGAGFNSFIHEDSVIKALQTIQDELDKVQGAAEKIKAVNIGDAFKIEDKDQKSIKDLQKKFSLDSDDGASLVEARSAAIANLTSKTEDYNKALERQKQLQESQKKVQDKIAQRSNAYNTYFGTSEQRKKFAFGQMYESIASMKGNWSIDTYEKSFNDIVNTFFETTKSGKVKFTNFGQDRLNNLASLLGIDLSTVKQDAATLQQEILNAISNLNFSDVKRAIGSGKKEFTAVDSDYQLAKQAWIEHGGFAAKERIELDNQLKASDTELNNLSAQIPLLKGLMDEADSLQNQINELYNAVFGELDKEAREQRRNLLQQKRNVEESSMTPTKEGYQKTTNKIQQMGSDLGKQNEANLAAQKAAAEAEAFKHNLQQSIKHWMGAQQVITLVKQGIRQAYQDIQGLDKAMTNIAVVTDFNVSDLWGKINEYMSIAQQYGVTTQGVYEVSQLYFQQGLGEADTMAATTETLKMARIAGMEYKDAADGMTVAIRGFNMEMQDAARVTDVYSKVAAITASDTQELVTAMSKTASSAAAVGSSFENTTAMLAVMIEATRESPQNLGSALKSIISRYGEMTKGVDIDEEGEEIDYNRVDAALKTVGISLKDAQGQFRNFDAVIEELSAKWTTLDSVTQRYIATIFAGNRQQSRFLALVSNYDRYMEVSEAAANSEDAGLLQYSKTLDSLETKLNNIKTSFQQFYMDIFDGPTVGKVLEFINDLIKGFNKLGKISSILNITSIIGAIKVVGTIIVTNFANSFSQISAAWNSTLKQMSSQTQIEGQAAGQKWYQGFTANNNNGKTSLSLKGTKLASAAMLVGSGLTMAGSKVANENQTAGAWLSAGGNALSVGAQLAMVNPMLGAIGGAIAGFVTLISSLPTDLEKAQQDLEKTQQEAEKANIKRAELRERANGLESTIKQLKDLEKAQYDSEEAQKAYIDASNVAFEKFPELTAVFDEAGNAIIDASNAEQLLASARADTAAATIDAAAKEKAKTSQQVTTNRVELNNSFGKASDFSYLTYHQTLSPHRSQTGVEDYNAIAAAAEGFSFDLVTNEVIREHIEENLKMTLSSGKTVYGGTAVKLARAVGNQGFTTDELHDLDQKSFGEIIGAFYDKNNSLISDSKFLAVLKSAGAIESDDEVLKYIQDLNIAIQEYKTSLTQDLAAEKARVIAETNSFINKKDPIGEGLDWQELQNASVNMQKAILKTVEKDTEELGKTPLEYQEDGVTLTQESQAYLNSLISNTYAQYQDLFDILQSSYKVDDYNLLIQDIESGAISYNEFNSRLIEIFGNNIPEALNSYIEDIQTETIKDTSNFKKALSDNRVNWDPLITKVQKNEIASTYFDEIIEFANKVDDMIEGQQISKDQGEKIAKSYTELWEIIDTNIDSNFKGIVSNLLQNADLTSIGGIMDFKNALESEGIDSDIFTNQFNNIIHNLSINVVTEYETLQSKIANNLDNMAKVFSDISSGIGTIEEVIKTANKLGVSLSDFRIEDGKFYFDDMDTARTAYEQEFSESKKQLFGDENWQTSSENAIGRYYQAIKNFKGTIGTTQESINAQITNLTNNLNNAIDDQGNFVEGWDTERYNETLTLKQALTQFSSGYLDFIKLEGNQDKSFSDYLVEYRRTEMEAFDEATKQWIDQLIADINYDNAVRELTKKYAGNEQEQKRQEALDSLISSGGVGLSGSELAQLEADYFGLDESGKVKGTFGATKQADGTWKINQAEMAELSVRAGNAASSIINETVAQTQEGLDAIGEAVAFKKQLDISEKRDLLGEYAQNFTNEQINFVWSLYEQALISEDGIAALESSLTNIFISQGKDSATAARMAKESIDSLNDNVEENIQNILDLKLSLLEGSITNTERTILEGQDESFLTAYDAAISASASERASKIFSLYEQVYTEQLIAGDITASEALENTAKAASQQLDEWLGTSLIQFNKEATQGIEEGDLTQTTYEFGQLFVSTRKNEEETLESFYNTYSKGITDAGEIILDVQKLRADNRISEQEYAKFQRNFAEETFGSAEDLITRMASKDDVYADEIESFFEALGAPLQNGEAELLLKGGIQAFLSKIENTLLTAGVPQSDIDSRLAEIQAQLVDLLLESISSGISSLDSGLKGTLGAADYQALVTKYGLTGSSTLTSKGVRLSREDQNILNRKLAYEAKQNGMIEGYGDQLWEVWRDSDNDPFEGYNDLGPAIEEAIKYAESLADQTSDAAKEAWAYVEALQQARHAAMFDEDSIEFAFMKQDATEGLTKNFDSFVNSIDKVKSALQGLKDTGKIGYNDFFNIIDYLGETGQWKQVATNMGLAEKFVEDYKLFGTEMASTTETIGQIDAKSFASIGMDVSTAATAMADGMNEGLKETARSQIEYLSGIEQMLLALQALESIGDVDLGLGLTFGINGKSVEINNLKDIVNYWDQLSKDQQTTLVAVLKTKLENGNSPADKILQEFFGNNFSLFDLLGGKDFFNLENFDIEAIKAITALSNLTENQAKNLAMDLEGEIGLKEGVDYTIDENSVVTYTQEAYKKIIEYFKNNYKDFYKIADVPIDFDVQTKINAKLNEAGIQIQGNQIQGEITEEIIQKVKQVYEEEGIQIEISKAGKISLLSQGSETLEAGETDVSITPNFILPESAPGTLNDTIQSAFGGAPVTIDVPVVVNPVQYDITEIQEKIGTLGKDSPFIAAWQNALNTLKNIVPISATADITWDAVIVSTAEVASIIQNSIDQFITIPFLAIPKIVWTEPEQSGTTPQQKIDLIINGITVPNIDRDVVASLGLDTKNSTVNITAEQLGALVDQKIEEIKNIGNKESTEANKIIDLGKEFDVLIKIGEILGLDPAEIIQQWEEKQAKKETNTADEQQGIDLKVAVAKIIVNSIGTVDGLTAEQIQTALGENYTVENLAVLAGVILGLGSGENGQSSIEDTGFIQAIIDHVNGRAAEPVTVQTTATVDTTNENIDESSLIAKILGFKFTPVDITVPVVVKVALNDKGVFDKALEEYKNTYFNPKNKDSYILNSGSWGQDIITAFENDPMTKAFAAAGNLENKLSSTLYDYINQGLNSDSFQYIQEDVLNNFFGNFGDQYTEILTSIEQLPSTLSTLSTTIDSTTFVEIANALQTAASAAEQLSQHLSNITLPADGGEESPLSTLLNAFNPEGEEMAEVPILAKVNKIELTPLANKPVELTAKITKLDFSGLKKKENEKITPEIDTEKVEEEVEEVNEKAEELNDTAPIIEVKGDASQFMEEASEVENKASEVDALEPEVTIVADGMQAIHTMTSLIATLKSMAENADISLSIDATPTVWTGMVNNISGSALAEGNASKLHSGASLANKTLVGELGPELAVYNGRYHLLGSAGAEFVKLPKDALVFNHLQTRGIMNGQMNGARAKVYGGRAQSVFNRMTGSAMATGNVSGPALASGIGGALEAVRRAKSVWQGLLNSLSAADLLGGGGGGGGGGGNDESLKAHIEDLQEWYNLSRKIADIEQQINTLLAKRENLTDGHEYLKNLRATQALLEDQVNTQADLMRFQEKQLKAQADFINNHDIWSKFLNVDENGLLQYNEGNETNGGKGALKVLQDLNEMSGSQQLKYITKTLGWSYTNTDGEELEDEELVAKFFEELQKQIDDYDALHDTVAETTQTLEELETEINEIEKEIRENEIELSQEIYDIIVDAWKENIDNLKKQNDLIKEANDAYAEGIQKALDAEREEYDNNQAIQEREQLQRQLSLLRRSGGSASEIADLEQQLNETLKDEYFRNQEQALDTIRDANERQVELMEQQVKIQEETLEYQQEQGIIWQKVYEVMQGTDAEILDFMQGNSTEFFEKSSLVQQDMLTEWAKMVGIYNEDKVRDYYTAQAEENINQAWDTERGKGLKDVYDSASKKDRDNWNREYYEQYAKAMMEGATETEALTKAQEELYEHLEEYKKAMEEKAKEEKKKKSSSGGGSSSSSSKKTQYYYVEYKDADGNTKRVGYNSSNKQEALAKANKEAQKRRKSNLNYGGRYTGTVNSIGPARYGGTLVGEFGMELGIWNDKWHLMGKNGPEMRNDIPSDALIFNHLQTAGILSGQYSNDFFSRKLSDIPSQLNASHNSALSSISSSDESSILNIEPGAVVVQVSQLNDKYDVNELYNDITDRIYSIASQSSGRGVRRR